MKTLTALTTVAALGVAGSALACGCEKSEAKETKQLTLSTAPAAVSVGHDSDDHRSKKKSESMTLKVVVEDGEVRYWVNGKEVDERTFNKAKEKAQANISVRGIASTPAAPRGKTVWRAAPKPEAPKAPKAAIAQKPMQLGVVLTEIDDAYAEKLHVDADEVIVIERVLEGTPAAKSGLKAKDVLIEFDGEDDLNVAKLRKLIAKQSPGDEVEVIVLRDGDDQEFEVIFGEKGNVFATAPTPPSEPKMRFFGNKLDNAQQEQIEKAMKLAEKYSAQAQENAARWTRQIEEQALQLEGMGQKLALRFDGEARADFEEAMAELHEALAENDFDFDFEFNFDAEDFPQIKFIELDDDHHQRAAVLEKRLHERAAGQRQRAEGLARRLEQHERRAESQRERSEAAAERHIDRLEQRIEELEEVIEQLVEKLEKDRRRGGIHN